jgi:hypothetical protein
LAAGLSAAGMARTAVAQPGVEQFAKQPETPLEFWEAADYLFRNGRPDQAAAFVRRFLESNPDDATLLEVRDEYGLGSVLRLEDVKPTAGLGRLVLDRINEAARRSLRDPERLRRLAGLLAASADERVLGIEGLRGSGPYAVAPVLEVLGQPGLTPEQRDAVGTALGELDRRALPALVALLDAPDPGIAGVGARALGRLGDPRAIPFLVATRAGGTPEVQAAADVALAGLKEGPQAGTDTVKTLADEARRYLSGAYSFPEGKVEVWRWSDEAKAPAPNVMEADEAETALGLKFAEKALALRPSDREAQVVALALRVDQATRRSGVAGFLGDKEGETKAEAEKASEAVLADVLEWSIQGKKWEVAAVAAALLGRGQGGQRMPPPALVEALKAADRRAQFMAARSLVEMDPPAAFPGSSGVVPTLARFLLPYSVPRAVVIDGNIHRANELATELMALGYEPEVATDGPTGFEAAARTGDVELIFLEPIGLRGPWRLPDLLANLRADARTAGLPILLHGESTELGMRFIPYTADDPLTEYLVVPPDAGALAVQLDRVRDRMGAPEPLGDTERREMARQAAGLLATIAARAEGAFVQDLPRAEAALAAAIRGTGREESMTATLATLPSVTAQRGLATLALDPSKSVATRAEAARRLAASIERFGPLLTDSQERRIAGAFASESLPDLGSAWAAVIEAMRRTPEPSGWPAPAAANPG